MCHICGYRVSETTECVKCKSSDNFIPIGPGVERIRDEVSKLFPEASSMIFSSDNLLKGEKNLEEMDKIKSGEINIIIGTQLVSKGYNFPHLKLVAVIDADMGLNAGDHRVIEKSYQVIKQVVGRAGRYASDGRALIQTWMPRHPVLQALLKDHGEKFLNAELEQRIEANVPPHGKFISLIISGKKERQLIDFGIKLKNQFYSLNLQDFEIFGPAVAPISRIKNKTRVRLLIKSNKMNKISQSEVRDWLKNISVPNNIYFSIDIDPYNFY
jgi:primosomal protein N' (replication factor Y)